MRGLGRGAVVMAGLLLVSVGVPPAVAGPLDGLAGAAVGFALGAMVARQRPAYYAPRPRRVAVYRARPAPRPRVAVARRHPTGGQTGFDASAASDPFAGSTGAKPIPVSGR